MQLSVGDRVIVYKMTDGGAKPFKALVLGIFDETMVAYKWWRGRRWVYEIESLQNLEISAKIHTTEITR